MSILVRFLGDFSNLLAGYKQGERGTKEFAEGVEDTARSFILAARQAGRSTDEIATAVGKAFGVPFDRAQRAVKEVGDEADRTAADIDDMYRRVESGASDAARATGKIKDQTRDVGSGLSELGSIARDALAGDVGGAAESALSGLATLGASLGLGGAIGSLVAESLGGLINNLVTAWDPFNEKTKQVRDDVAAALVEMGGAFDSAAIDERLRATAADTEKWTQATALAKATGMELSDALRAVAGVSQGESAAAFQALQAAMNDTNSEAQNLSLYTLRDLEHTLQGNSDGFSDAASRTEALNAAMQGTAAEADKAKTATDQWVESLRNVPGGVDVIARLKIDDTEVRRYKPPVIQFQGSVRMPAGSRQLIF